MKIINLNINQQIQQTGSLIKAILQKDLDAFKATKMQFLRNNQAYTPTYPGMTA